MKRTLPMAVRRPSADRRGFALPVVLLVLAAMSAMALRMVEQSRSGISVAHARLDEAVARNAADAGYEMFLVRYAEVTDLSDLPGFEVGLGGARVSVRAVAESGKIDLNIGVPELIAGILQVVGAEEAQAEAIAEAVAAFRTNGGIFHTVDELIRIPGMDFGLMAALRPYVTVYFAAPGVDAITAPREVLMAIPEMTEGGADRIIAARGGEASLEREERVALRAFRSRGRPVFTVVATARLADGASFVREAVVDLSDPTTPVLLAWGRASAAPAPVAMSSLASE